MTLPALTAIAIAISAVLTGLALPLLRRLGAIAHTNDRTMHVGTIPKGGGLPLLAAAAATLSLAETQSMMPSAMAMAGAVALLAILSFVNDIRHLPAPIRLAAHAIAALLFLASLPADARIADALPLWLERGALALALVAYMNFFNFMDGINAVAGAEAMAICLGYLAIAAATAVAPNFSPLAATLAGATLGFLFWNARPCARVFLGDAGSIPLGFLTGALLIDLAATGHWPAALILPSYFIADAGLTLAKRMARGEHWWEPHRTHAYQRAARAYGSHLAIVARIAIANAALVGAALVSLSHPAAGLALAAGILLVLMITLEAIARSRSSDIGP